MKNADVKSGIDFVVSWVDGSDPAWLAERNRWAAEFGEAAINEARYRDWDLLRYWFRGVERCAPWVDNIYFVTWGHVPAWLDTSNPKLKIVKHEDYMPAEYLPTFNSSAIELNLHRIKGISETFVYFNDDVFVLRPVKPSYFFRGGLPRDFIGLDAISFKKGTHGHIMAENIEVVNDHFEFAPFVRRCFFKIFNPFQGLSRFVKNVLMAVCIRRYFPGFSGRHAFMSFTKSTYGEIWKAEFGKLDRTCRCKFRRPDQVSAWLMRYWDLAKGTFASANPASYGRRNIRLETLDEILKLIRRRRYNVMCVNDNSFLKDFERVKKEVQAAFAELFPERSSFEKEGVE